MTVAEITAAIALIVAVGGVVAAYFRTNEASVGTMRKWVEERYISREAFDLMWNAGKREMDQFRSEQDSKHDDNQDRQREIRGEMTGMRGESAALRTEMSTLRIDLTKHTDLLRAEVMQHTGKLDQVIGLLQSAANTLAAANINKLK